MASEFDLENALLDEAGCGQQQNIYEMQRQQRLAYQQQQKALFQQPVFVVDPQQQCEMRPTEYERRLRQLAREQAQVDEQHRREIEEIRRVQEEERIRLNNELMRFMSVSQMPEPHGIQQPPVQNPVVDPPVIPFSPEMESDEHPLPAFERPLKRVQGTVVDDE